MTKRLMKLSLILALALVFTGCLSLGKPIKVPRTFTTILHIDFEEENWEELYTINKGAFIDTIDGTTALQHIGEGGWNRVSVTFAEPLEVTESPLYLRLRYRVDSEAFADAGHNTNDWTTVRLYYDASSYIPWHPGVNPTLGEWEEIEVDITTFDEFPIGSELHAVMVYERAFGGLENHLMLDYVEFFVVD